MTTSASAAAAAAPGRLPDIPTAIQRMAGVVMRPGRTFRQLLADPQWRTVLVLSTAIAVVTAAAVMNTTVGRQALVDQWERTAAALGHQVDDAGYQQLEAWGQYAALYGAVGALLNVPVLALGMAVLIHAAGRRARPFATVFAVTTYAGVILSLRQVVSAVSIYMAETTASRLTLGAAFPGLDAASPAARALGFVDLFVVWWVIVLGVGVARVYGRRARSTSLAFLGAYAVLAVLAAIVFRVAGGNA